MKSEIKIMIVEDSKIIASKIRKSLENMGYLVTAIVGSGEEAIKKAEEGKPSLALMDILLEGKMDGIEAAGTIRSRFDIPCIYLTAYADQKILDRAKITEPFGYIIKPFQDRELHSNIEMALYKHEAEKKLKKLNQELQDSLAKVKSLRGLLPICANCKDVRDDKGNWERIENYIANRSEAEFSHGICLKCSKKLYPEFHDKI